MTKLRWADLVHVCTLHFVFIIVKLEHVQINIFSILLLFEFYGKENRLIIAVS